MYKVFCDRNEHEFEDAREVISFITYHHSLYKNHGKFQLIQIRFNETKDFLEIAIGMADKSMLFFSPKSDLEDKKISCNKCKSLINSKEDIQLNTFNGGIFKCSQYNLIEYQDALGAVKYFLKYKKPSDQISWYAY